jgi:acetyl-CoA carboxylase/biotin carboxylase 1
MKSIPIFPGNAHGQISALHKRLGSVHAKKVAENRWMITDIIGSQDGLGVENLRGSGMIAGETSRAYEETFTLTLVTGRTVGIGAYLVRLGNHGYRLSILTLSGQRTIQNKGPVILTGASALNKVLGRNVYTSNVQLGGTQIMFANGVSHVIVNDEVEGVSSILQWISYIPSKRGGKYFFFWGLKKMRNRSYIGFCGSY